jgi:hypothetical protein
VSIFFPTWSIRRSSFFLSPNPEILTSSLSSYPAPSIHQPSNPNRLPCPSVQDQPYSRPFETKPWQAVSYTLPPKPSHDPRASYRHPHTWPEKAASSPSVTKTRTGGVYVRDAAQRGTVLKSASRPRGVTTAGARLTRAATATSLDFVTSVAAKTIWRESVLRTGGGMSG